MAPRVETELILSAAPVEELPMTPVAAYYIYVASEHERAAQALREARPSLLDRIRALFSGHRPKHAARPV